MVDGQGGMLLLYLARKGSVDTVNLAKIAKIMIWGQMAFLAMALRLPASTYNIGEGLETSSALQAQQKAVMQIERYLVGHYNDSSFESAEYEVELRDGGHVFRSAGLYVLFRNNRAIPKSMFVLGRASPQLTNEQKALYKKNKAIPPSYKKIDTSQAIALAESFFAFLLGDSAAMYDSTELLEYDKEYIVRLRVPQVGDVHEGRHIDVEINAATGKILSYHGETFKAVPTQYQPVINRETATAIVEDYAESKGFDVRVHELSIHGGSICVKGYRTVWQAFVELGREENGEMKWYWSPCEECFRCAICVDAEAGEVTGANLPAELEPTVTK